MVVQYPDLIMASLPGQDATYVNGEWVQGGTPDNYSFIGRYEPDGGNGLVKGTNGDFLNYSGIIYCPKDTVKLPFGTQVTIIKSLDANVSSSLIYTPSNEVVEITATNDSAVIDDRRLVGKRYSLERRGIGRLKADEWVYTSTGFRLTNGIAKTDETFFACVYAVQTESSIQSGANETVTVDTVKLFSRGQLNCRIWL